VTRFFSDNNPRSLNTGHSLNSSYVTCTVWTVLVATLYSVHCHLVPFADAPRRDSTIVMVKQGVLLVERARVNHLSGPLETVRGGTKKTATWRQPESLVHRIHAFRMSFLGKRHHRYRKISLSSRKVKDLISLRSAWRTQFPSL